MSAIRALVFDVGRVIVRVDIERALATLGRATPLPPDQLWMALRSDPRMQDFQEGRLSAEQWHEHLVGRFGLQLAFDEFCAAWNSALDPEPILPTTLFASLAMRHRLVLLSNTDPIHVAHLEANFEFPRIFAARVYSCQVGASKPSPEVYRRAIAEARAPAEQILCVDDDPACVAAGHKAGMQAIQFVGAEPLLTELRGRGLLSS